MGAEEAAIKAELHLTDKLKSQSLNRHRPAKLTDEDLTQLYFKQLSKKDVADLFRLYENDFRLFDYAFKFQDMTFP